MIQRSVCEQEEPWWVGAVAYVLAAMAAPGVLVYVIIQWIGGKR